MQQYSSFFAENKGIGPNRGGNAGAKKIRSQANGWRQGCRGAFQLPEQSM